MLKLIMFALSVTERAVTDLRDSKYARSSEIHLMNSFNESSLLSGLRTVKLSLWILISSMIEKREKETKCLELWSWNR